VKHIDDLAKEEWFAKMANYVKKDNHYLSVCKYCVRKSKNGPKYATSNGLDFTMQPPELKNINFLEKNLIELVHPIQSQLLLL
jgi:hypothetical protein